MGASGDAFLNLFLQGAQGGLNRFFQQQDQSTNLALTLHQMMQRQANADRAFGLQQEGLDFRKQQVAQDRNARASQFANERLQEILAQLRQQKLDAAAARRDDAYIRNIESLIESRGGGGGAPSIADIGKLFTKRRDYWYGKLEEEGYTPEERRAAAGRMAWQDPILQEIRSSVVGGIGRRVRGSVPRRTPAQGKTGPVSRFAPLTRDEELELQWLEAMERDG